MKDNVGKISSPAIVCHGGAGHSAKDQPGVDAAVEAGWKYCNPEVRRWMLL